jgi:predicted amidohydrolase
VAAAQMGATHRRDSRQATLHRMLDLLGHAATAGAQVVLFPELAFTTFFPRYLIEDDEELDSWFEHGDVTQSPNTRLLFDGAHHLGIDIGVGFAEATQNGDRFNSCVYYHAKTKSIISKYRKVHLPGEYQPYNDSGAAHQLEKRYFKVGDLGFNAFRVSNLTTVIIPPLKMQYHALRIIIATHRIRRTNIRHDDL